MRRRWLVMVLLVAATMPLPAQQVQAPRPMQADGIVRLLTELESALAGNNPDEFRRLTAAGIAASERSMFLGASFGEGQNTASVRERDRRPSGDGSQVLVEVLIGRGRRGRISTWQLQLQPEGPAGNYVIAGATPVASVDGLVQVELDSTRQFEVRDLVLQAPGLMVTLHSGHIFLATVDDGPTGMVFRGKGLMTFAPPDAAEQVQVRAFAGRPQLETQIEGLFLRLSPAEWEDRVASGRLSPVTVNPGDLARARQVFDESSRRSYTLNLGDLTSDRWSLLPPVGDTLAELRTRRFGTLTYVRSADDAEDVSLFDRQRGRNISVYASPERLLTRGPYYSEDASTSYDVEHYAIDVRFDPERDWVTGRGTLRLRTKVEGLATLSLKLAESLNVSSISSPELGRVLSLRIQGQSGVLISLPQALPRDSVVVLDVLYSGRLPGQAIDREALTVSADEQAQAGADARAQDPVIPPEPRFLYSNRTYWYPQASVTDFATAAIQVTVPAQYQVVASGSLINSTVTPAVDGSGRSGDSRAQRTVQFLADRPLRYIACIISRFVPVGSLAAEVPGVAPPVLALSGTRTEVSPTVAVDVVATPRLLRANRTLPDRVADILGYYARIIGEAPYPNMTVAALDAEIPSGHSPAFFAIWNQPTLPTTLSWREDPVAINGHPFFFLAHEVAHQWFGQSIGWKNYHEQWLSEGLSQFFAAEYAGHDRGPEIGRQLFAQMRASAVELSRHGPVHLGYRLGHVQGDGRIFRGLVYNKSAVVLHMLRRLIGDDAFGRGIRRFYRTHRFTKAGTDDLQAAFEAEAGITLDRFFQRWILGFTLPDARLSWRMDPDGAHVFIRVEQTGDTFDFPLTVRLEYANGQSGSATLLVTSSVHEVRLAVPAAVRQVDPRDELTLAVVKR